jgi:hypothetical protein
MSARLKHPCQFGTRVGGTHKRLADEEGVDAVAAHKGDVVGGEDAGFGDRDAHLNPLPRRGRGRSDFGQQVEGGLQADLEGAQVAIVDALQRGGQLQGGVEFGGVVRFDQHRHAEAVGEGLEVAHGGDVESREGQSPLPPFIKEGARRNGDVHVLFPLTKGGAR